MRLPANWNEITVSTFLELRDLKSEDFGSVSEMMLEVIAVLSGDDPDDLGELPSRKVKELYQRAAFIHKMPRSRAPQQIEINGEKFTYKGIDSISLSEWIDLTEWNEENPDEEKEVELHKMAALLYRKTRLGEWGETIFEPRVYDLEGRAREILEQPLPVAWGVVNDFRNWNESVRSTYEGLFTDPDDDEDDDPEDETPDRRTIGKMKAEALKKAKKKHQWQKLVHDFSGGDITKRVQVLQTPAIYVLNVLAMHHDLNEKGAD